MVTRKLIPLKTHIKFVDEGFLTRLARRTLAGFANSFLVFVFTLTVNLSGFIARCKSRFRRDDVSQKIDVFYDVVQSRTEDPIVADSSEDSAPEKEHLEFYFAFCFEESKCSFSTNKNISETESSVFMESASAATASKFQYFSGEDICGFMAKPETESFTNQGKFLGNSFRGSNDQSSTVMSSLMEEKVGGCHGGPRIDFTGSAQSDDTEVGAGEDLEITEDPVKLFCSENDTWRGEVGIVDRRHLCHNQETDSPEAKFLDEQNHSFKFDIIRPVDDKDIGFVENIPRVGDGRDKMEEEEDYIELNPFLDNSIESDNANLSRKEFGKTKELQEPEAMDGAGKFKDQSSEVKLWDSDSEFEDESDILWEHKTLVEQMKMEMRNSRTGGLPTILEESETPKMAEDLKPLRIETKTGHKDHMEEIHKLYKIYAEKMRKLDVLNFQTMQAINFQQRKETVQLNSGKRSSVSPIKSHILQNFWPSKLRRIYVDPTNKSINELHRDLELVYVGQLCLSWEILCWQHRKTKELLDLGSNGSYAYNRVAGEYQQFQVLVQRFVEDEPFQEPRVRNYAKNRFLVCSFLQVPNIKDDCLKDKTGDINVESSSVSLAMLGDIISEAMQVFWEFLRADKHQVNTAVIKYRYQIDCKDPTSLQLLLDIKTNLQKKERRVKDEIRSKNCILKKFQRHHQGGGLDLEVFLCQVELRLILRVLCLSRLTADQLLWCQNKLGNTNVTNGRICVQPSFLLFPC